MAFSLGGIAQSSPDDETAEAVVEDSLAGCVVFRRSKTGDVDIVEDDGIKEFRLIPGFVDPIPDANGELTTTGDDDTAATGIAEVAAETAFHNEGGIAAGTFCNDPLLSFDMMYMATKNWLRLSFIAALVSTRSQTRLRVSKGRLDLRNNSRAASPAKYHHEQEFYVRTY